MYRYRSAIWINLPVAHRSDVHRGFVILLMLVLSIVAGISIDYEMRNSG